MRATPPRDVARTTESRVAAALLGQVGGRGNGTVFRRNTATGVPGYAINVDRNSTDRVVACDNTAEGSGLGLSSVDCQ